MKKLSIKLRVTLWFTCLMLLIVALTLGFLFSVGEQLVASGFQSRLRDVVAASLDEINEDDGKIEIDDDLESFQNGVYVAVYDEEGRLLYGRLPSSYVASQTLVDGQVRTETDGEGEKWYLYDLYYPVEHAGAVWVRGVMPLADSANAFLTMMRLAAAAFPALTLLAGAVGYFLVNRAFRPVRQIAQAAEQISDGRDLTRRIGLQNGRDEIYGLAATFDGMFDRLQQSFDREKQFTSDVSHELRTPTAVIISQCEYALEDAETKGEAREALETVLEQAQRMSAMISQLLTLSRGDRGQTKLHLELIHLSELTEMVAEQAAEQAQEKNISVITELEPDILYRGDETMLMRLFLNLMENGIKYGKPGGHLWVRLRRENDMLVWEAEDDGIGIAPEHLPKIWERFYQVDEARSSSQQGVGLGLPMVKYIAEAHGGRAEAFSQPGKGSRFVVTLPAADIEEKI